MELLSTLDQESIEADGTVWPFFDLSFYISKISWAMEGVDLGRLEWGGLPVRAWTIAGLCLLAMALVSTLAAGILFVSALGNKRDKENA